jgi:hypothetical protein
MSMTIENFQSEVARRIDQFRNMQYPDIDSELTTIATALSTDPRMHDQTIVEPMDEIEINARTQTQFTNFINIIVNKGRGSLTGSEMANALAGMGGSPANTVAPVVSGTGTVGQALSCTTGTWTYSPTSYTYQWRRNITTIPGATAATYTLVAADSGMNVSCLVTAINPTGQASISSNAVAVT